MTTSTKTSDIEHIFAWFAAHNAAPKTELNYTSEFELLIAVILSAQATDVGVNAATKHLFAVANTPAKILALGYDGLASYVRTINLYPTKTKHILKTCEMLLAQHAGQVPHTREALEALAGVGRKTANVILNSAFGYPTIAVDTHIFRVSNRVGLSNGKTPLAVEHDLLRCIPPKFIQNAHHWLVLHGRYVCKARTPLCESCGIRTYCDYGKGFS